MFEILHPIASAPMWPYRTTELAIVLTEAGGLGTISHSERSMDGEKANNIIAMKKNLDYVIEHTDGVFAFSIRTSRLELDNLR